MRSDESIVHVVQGMPIEALLIMFRAMLPELLTSKMQTIKEVLTAPPAEEDDEDDLEYVDDAADAASRAANGEKAEGHVGNDNISAWMYEMANANRAVPQPAAAEAPQCRQENQAQQQKVIHEMQKQLLDLLNEGKMHRSRRNEQATGQGQQMDNELLHSLIGRMRGTVAPPDEETPPSTKGLNGALEM